MQTPLSPFRGEGQGEGPGMQTPLSPFRGEGQGEGPGMQTPFEKKLVC
jgi:hypothetical protein